MFFVFIEMSATLLWQYRTGVDVETCEHSCKSTDRDQVILWGKEGHKNLITNGRFFLISLLFIHWLFPVTLTRYTWKCFHIKYNWGFKSVFDIIMAVFSLNIFILGWLWWQLEPYLKHFQVCIHILNQYHNKNDHDLD